LLLDAFNPLAARGNLLSNLAPLMNKRRRLAVKSTVTLTVTADANGATIPAGSIVAQAAGPEKFVTLTEVVVAPSSSETVEAEAQNAGAIIALAGSLTKIDTPVFGWDTVTNLADASPGRARDTDGVLRARMLQTSSAPSGTPEGIFTAVTDVPGVTYAKILFNKTNAVDAIGVPAKAVFPIIEGGLDSEIGDALLGSVNATSGYATDADIPSATMVEVIVTNPANLQSESVWFARPSDNNITVEIEIEVEAGEYPGDGATRIRDAIVAFLADWEVGKKLYSSRLYTPINTVPGIDINTVTINLADSVTPQPYERLKIADPSTDIVITVV
ncbi:MAG: hypothetical protein R3183_06830, partial [Oleiphilaceae bacterium]|nr:hypothetical protein [Oleiphilaceae bacterium]